MEALGSPSISRVPMGGRRRGAAWGGGGHAFRIPKTSVCRWQVQRQYTFVRLPEIHFTASGLFLKIFDYLCIFVCFFLVLFYFFCESTCYEKQEKKQQQQQTTTKKTPNIKYNNNLRTVRTNTLLCRSFYR